LRERELCIISRSNENLPKIIDLSSGAGGFSLGAARAGFSVCGAIEIDPRAMSVHRLNFPQTAHIDKDVSELSGKELKSIAGIKNGDLV
jgi:DNA (cytosine-5)-methyltransferase 1